MSKEKKLLLGSIDRIVEQSIEAAIQDKAIFGTWTLIDIYYSWVSRLTSIYDFCMENEK